MLTILWLVGRDSIAIALLTIGTWRSMIMASVAYSKGTCQSRSSTARSATLISHKFRRVQAPSEVTEALRVDGGGLFNQYPDILAEELDGGMDHGSEGLGRRRGYESSDPHTVECLHCALDAPPLRSGDQEAELDPGTPQ